MIAVVTSVLLAFSQQSVVLPSGKKCSWKQDYRLYEKSDPVAGIEIIPGLISGTPKKDIEASRPELVASGRQLLEVAPGHKVRAKVGFSSKRKLLSGVYFEGTDYRPVLAAFTRKYGRPTLSKLSGSFNDTKAAVPITGAVHPPKGEAFKWCTDSISVYLFDQGDKYSASISVDFLPLKGRSPKD